jgi:hypothetical protein
MYALTSRCWVTDLNNDHSSTKIALSISWQRIFLHMNSNCHTPDVTALHKLFKSHVKSSQAGFLYSSVLLVPVTYLLTHSWSWGLLEKMPIVQPLQFTLKLQCRAEQSSCLLPATSQHGHSWHRAPLGPMAIYLFSVKTFVFSPSFVVPPLIKREWLDFFL